MPTATVSDKTFGREVLSAAIPVLVEFSAEHAPSSAALDELSSELVGKLKVVRVDVGRHASLRKEYEVHGLPTLVLFKYGKPVSRVLGARLSNAELEEWIDGALILALATRKNSTARSASEFKLANGMHVVVIPDHRARVVTHMVWYKVGSADEPKGFSGLARLLEHLTFKSLNKVAGGPSSRIGEGSNAILHRDATVFWQRVPRKHLKTVMEMEVDRMRKLRIDDDDVATEREVMLEQRRSSVEIDPRARLVEKMNAVLYRGHPYGLPAFGLPDEAVRLTRDDVLAFHRLHYAPNKAILVVSGDVTPEEVKQLAHKTYGRILANENAAQRARPKLPAQLAARRVRLDDPHSETLRFYRSYAVPAYGKAECGEAEALHVLTRILAGWTASRLYRKLVIADKVATSVLGDYLSNTTEAGELTLRVLAADAPLSAVEASVDGVLEDIRNNGVSQEELGCAKKFLVADHFYNSSDRLNLASRYGWATALGRTIKDVEDWPAAISRVSADDVRKVARAYLISRRSVTGLLSRKRAGKDARQRDTLAVAR
jgi:zinc protease